MEILKITDSKMKITLDENDMKNYSVTEKTLDCANPASRKKLWSILDAVKNRCGFDIAGERAFIQCYPSRDGGCELFVTKLGILSENTERAIVKSGKIAMVSQAKSSYLFDSLDDLCLAVRKISSVLNAEKSDVYVCENGRYLLTVEERNCSDAGDHAKLPSPSYAFSEFAKVPQSRSGVWFSAFLTEHTRCLTNGDALTVFAKV